jgi:PEP-CTERM motif
MKIIAVALFVLAFAVQSHADTYYNITGTATVQSNSACNCPETFSFSTDLDLNSGFLNVVPGTSKVTSASGPFGQLTVIGFSNDDDSLEFDPVKSFGAGDIELVVFLQAFPGVTIGSYSAATGLYDCLAEPICEDDFATVETYGYSCGNLGCTYIQQNEATVTVTQISNPTVPEPSTLLLLFAGAAIALTGAGAGRRGLTRRAAAS